MPVHDPDLGHGVVASPAVSARNGHQVRTVPGTWDTLAMSGGPSSRRATTSSAPSSRASTWPDLSDEHFAVVDQALLDHQVLFFHDQDLSDDEHLAFAARFGEPSVFPVGKVLGPTHRMQYIEDTADSPPDADGWHTDVTWIECPPRSPCSAPGSSPRSAATPSGRA